MKLSPRSLAIAATVFLLSVPSYSLAAVRNAGLIDGVWFSSNEPMENTDDTIYAGVLNQADTTISGTVMFASDGVSIGTTNFSVSPDQIERVSIVHSFTAGDHAISARVTSLTDSGQVSYTQLTERILVVDTKPVVPQTVYIRVPATSSNTTTNTSNTPITNSSSTIIPVSSTTNTTVRSTATVVNAFGGGVSSATTPLIKAITASRDQIVPYTSSSTPSSALDILTPTKNLFDVTLDIASQVNRHSIWDSVWALFLSILDWILYCIIPILGIIFIIFGWRKLSHRYSH